MNGAVRVTTKGIIESLSERLKAVGRKRILVGVPEDPAIKGNEVTNAEKLYRNTVGSPMQNVPPRPVLQPAIEDKLETISKAVKNAALKGIEGDMQGLQEGYEMAGLMGQAAAVGWWDNPKNVWAPNSAYTIKRKGSNHPMIDTGQLRHSITFIVDDGGR